MNYMIDIAAGAGAASLKKVLKCKVVYLRSNLSIFLQSQSRERDPRSCSS